ncbi:STAS domain-containing protein [Streptomyces fungicidicus]|uniref:STAS domain-containing protein n=1 Tax=Streptomyces fungicidicus TaxID=68203 RepID=UPI003403112C
MPIAPDAGPLRTLPPTDPHTLCLALVGDLDYEVGDEVLHQVRRALRAREDLRELRLDCRELATTDSTGLSVLLQLHRDAGRDGVGFHLDNVGPVLERLLRVTGTYEHLRTGRPDELPADPEATAGESGALH